ncbi:TetR/AcrR family transcriptional regulator [Microbacterium sp. A84]|uniref:TetR/AcrR family transcriptional regulator n=1 Tax=Microbacterium sp. A84 TaxID=3450715 RepID=UPI003F41DB7D
MRAVDAETIAATPVKLERWRSIRSAAIALIERDGYAAVSIDHIAQAAAISRRTFFNYFDSKSSVLFDPDPSQARSLAELLDAESPEGDLWGALTRSLSAYMQSQSEIVTTRRRILHMDPTLYSYFLQTNSHFKETLVHWLTARGMDSFHGSLFSGMALTVVRESFLHWNADDGADALGALMARGFSVVATGIEN